MSQIYEEFEALNDSNDFEGYYPDLKRLSWDLWQAEEFDRGVAILEIGYQLFPESFEAMNVLAEAYAETQQSRKALALYETLESKLDKAGKLDNSWIPYLKEQKAKLRE